MTEQTFSSAVLHALTMLALVVHIAAGVFVGSMLVMATFAIYLGIVLPGQMLNAFIGTFALYLVSTAWITVRRREGSSGLFEKVALCFSCRRSCRW